MLKYENRRAINVLIATTQTSATPNGEYPIPFLRVSMVSNPGLNKDNKVHFLFCQKIELFCVSCGSLHHLKFIQRHMCLFYTLVSVVDSERG